MVGIPRIGKSTWINKNKNDAIVVSSDTIRKELFGHQYHSPANKFVFAIVEAMTLLLLKQNKDVIIDSTSLSKASRGQWYSVAKSTNAIVTVVWVFADKDNDKNAEIAIKRSHRGPENERVPDDNIRSMSYSFEEPIEDWYSVIKVHNK
jgi:predicted kinase